MQNKNFKIKIMTLFAVFLLVISASAADKVYLGGFPFGVQMTTDGVFIAGLGEVDSNVGKVSPAKDAGIREGDIIISVNGERAEDIEAVSDIIGDSNGKRIKMELKRGSELLTVNVIPVKASDNSGYKTGLFIKDSASGIGTVTYVESDGVSFGGLGHGISDRATLGLLPLKEGSVHGVKIKNAVKGSDDAPGELKGTLLPEAIGELLKNTDMGVFGRLEKKLRGLEEIELAAPGEIKEGECTVYSCLEGVFPKKYSAEIIKIVDKNAKTKNFVVTLTDKEALGKAGGIVQGMSGSPIVQNGKLVGAVTHVLMKDQKSGYGIFIENMINEAKAS